LGTAIKPTHLTDYLEMHSRKLPDKPAIICEDRQLSWSELDQEVSAAAAALSAKIEPSANQQVVQILLPNGWQFIIAYLAIIKLGHIALPLDPAYKKLELDAIIKQIPAVVLITDGHYIDLINADDTAIMRAEELADGRNYKFKPLRFSAGEQVASLTFTSGTTGKPKAVPNTHANHIWNIEVCSQAWDWTSHDSLLISLPLSHWYGIVMGLSGALYHGNTLYIHQWFDERKTLETLATGKISLFTHAASAYIKLLQFNGKYDLSKVRLCISGGAPLPPAVWHEFKSRFGIEILETYGSSETGRIAGNSLDKRILGSPGEILPGVSVRIDKNGEVLVKSEGLFPGYYQNPEATAASLTSDGYWETGDIGEIKDGYIFLKGRRQERIRRFGYTISPRDVEWSLLNNPKIKDAYVMGNQRSGQPNDELVYFIVGDIGQAELNDYAKQNLLFAWRPDKIIHLDDLPRTRSGKPKISSLKQLAEETI
jgi:acyl-CoA synthetase (AMP-forming)/AMP-acid ligase II